MRRNRFIPKPNYNWSVFTVSIILFFLALVGFLSVHSTALIKHYKEQLTVLVELKSDRPSSFNDELQSFLKAQDAIIESSIMYVSKEAAYEELQHQMGLGSNESDLPNPLLDTYHFRVSAPFVKSALLKDLSTEIQAFHTAIDGVHYQDVMFDTLFRHLDKLVLIIVAAIILILPIALLLIVGAVRLSLFDQRFLIRNMELLGASWSFIRRPFLRKAFRLSVISMLLGFAPLIFLIGTGLYRFPHLLDYFQWQETSAMFFGLLLLSMILYVGCSYQSVTRYLRMEAV